MQQTVEMQMARLHVEDISTNAFHSFKLCITNICVVMTCPRETNQEHACGKPTTQYEITESTFIIEAFEAIHGFTAIDCTF